MKSAMKQFQVPRFNERQGGGAGFSLLGRLGQTSGFSNIFNPAIGFAGDALFAGSSLSESGDSWNRFHLRSAELGISSVIDPYGWAYAVIESHMGEHVGVPEAAGNLYVGPDEWNLRVKAGKFLTDFGKLNQVHDHDLPFVERPGTLEAFLGGSNIGKGVEIHQWFGLNDDIPFRWSVGVFNSMEGHSHAVDSDEGHEGGSSRGYRGFGDFAWAGRGTLYTELSDTVTLQAGLSGIFQGKDQVEHGGKRFVLEDRAVYGLDLTLKWEEETGAENAVFGIELLRWRGDYLDEVVEPARPARDGALGGFAYAVYSWNKHWSGYLVYDRHEVPGHGRICRSDYSIGITWDVSRFSRLRAAYSFRDVDHGEDYHVFYLQWVWVIGTHAHGLDW